MLYVQRGDVHLKTEGSATLCRTAGKAYLKGSWPVVALEGRYGVVSLRGVSPAPKYEKTDDNAASGASR